MEKTEEEMPSFPSKTVGSAVVLTVLLIGWMSWSVVDAFRFAELTRTHFLPIQQLQGQIVRYDEILTMSARMGAATGDEFWLDRHHRFELSLDKAITEIIGHSHREIIGHSHSSDMQEMAMNMQRANTNRIKMEHRAFQLVEKGRLADAQLLLSSDSYEKQKAINAGQMSDILFLHQNIIDGRVAAQRKYYILLIGALIAICIITFVTWIVVFRSTKTWHAAVTELMASRTKAEEELRKTHHELQESEERFAVAMRRSNDGLWDWNLETDYVYFSPRWCGMLGYTPEEIEPSVNGWMRLIDPRDKSHVFKETLDFIGANNENFEIEYQMRHKNGSWVRVLSRSFLVHGSDKVDRLVGVHADVTEHRKAEQRLIDSIESIPEGFVFYDKDDRLVVCNDKYKEMYAASAAVMIPGKTFEEVVRYGVACDQYVEAKGREEEFINERVAKHRNPTEVVEQLLTGGRWMRIEERKTRDGGIVGIRTDITELKNTEAELVQNRTFLEETVAKRTKELQVQREKADAANLAKSAFMVSMSYELRNSLNAIIGRSELLIAEEGDEKPAILKFELQKIQDSGKHLLYLINDIMDIFKIETNRMVLQLETVDIGDLVDDMVETTTPLMETYGNSLEVIKTGDLSGGITDIIRLRQILLNLLNNSAKFTENGDVTLMVERIVGSGPDEFQFSVRDTGIGIAENRLGVIFDAFELGDISSLRKYGGSGLGLAITRRLCEMMGGDITVRSTPGLETVFTVRIPVEVTAAISDETAVKRSVA